MEQPVKLQKAPKKGGETKGEVKNPNEYLINFIIQKGGPRKVQHHVKLGYQAIRQFANGERFGRAESFQKFADAYSDFNMFRAIKGKGPVDETPEPVRIDPDLALTAEEWKALYLKERQLRETEQAENTRLRKANERLSTTILEKAGLLTDLEGSKIESSSQTTVFADYDKQIEADRESKRVYGLVRYEEPVDELDGVIYPLNSLDQELAVVLQSA